MTTPAITTEPIYIEVPAQRTYKAAYFVANYATLVFLMASMFMVSWVPLHVYLILAASVLALTTLSYLLVRKVRPVVREKLLSEFKQQTGLALPDTFDPQKLPRKAFTEKVLVTDENGSPVEWTAARNGTFFRFAPA
jgi:hypothetical protein